MATPENLALVATLRSAGRTGKQIAAVLGISAPTLRKAYPREPATRPTVDRGVPDLFKASGDGGDA